MIKTFIHNIKDIEKRDKDINLFVQEHGSKAMQTNIIDDKIISTLFYGVN